MKIITYTREELDPVIAEGVSSFPTRGQWIAKLTDTLAKMVIGNPIAYRSFGPFWFPLKALMISHGVLNGEAPDPDRIAEVTLGDPAYDLAAAWVYHEHNYGVNQSNVWTVDTDEGDTIDYSARDDEMENRERERRSRQMSAAGLG